MPFKMHKIIFISRKKCVPTLAKIFILITRNTLIFSFGLSNYLEYFDGIFDIFLLLLFFLFLNLEEFKYFFF